jgi:hypothetical protein
LAVRIISQFLVVNPPQSPPDTWLPNEISSLPEPLDVSS